MRLVGLYTAGRGAHTYFLKVCDTACMVALGCMHGALGALGWMCVWPRRSHLLLKVCGTALHGWGNWAACGPVRVDSLDPRREVLP